MRDKELAARVIEEASTFAELVRTPCPTDTAMLVKLRYLLAREVMVFGDPAGSRAEFATIAQAVAIHFEGQEND